MDPEKTITIAHGSVYLPAQDHASNPHKLLGHDEVKIPESLRYDNSAGYAAQGASFNVNSSGPFETENSRAEPESTCPSFIRIVS
jgi:hypothetical protein